MILFPLLFSFLGFFFTLFLGKFIGIYYSCLFTTFCIFLCFLVSGYIFYFVGFNHIILSINLCSWFNLDTIFINWELLIDPLTSTMLVVITSISFLAHLYSIEYMHGDPHQVRFMSYLSLFTFFMLVLVYADNFLLLFVGWEGVGICSYLLINFWYTRISANKASMMAIITNKLGDLALMLAFTILFFIFKSLTYSTIFSVLYYSTDIMSYLSVICFLFILGAVGKSAQVGLHIWLPEAMEGPTPVSSLIHAATMVTAGIFLVIRSSFLFEYLNNSLFLVIILLGSITCFFASTIGLFQNDLKKIVAYSTCSQLGYMFLACGLSGYYNSMYHLFNHAFFKALLFLTAGYMIHGISNEQDMRKLGGLVRLLPFPYLMLTIGSLSLMGFPFFSGFYSKEKILELFTNKLSMNTSQNLYLLESIYMLSYILAYTAIIFTMLYSIKLLVLSFFGSYNGYLGRLVIFVNNSITTLLSYSSYYMLIPLIILSVLSIISGYLFSDLMLGAATDYWSDSLSIVSSYFGYTIYNSIQLSTLNTTFNYEFYIYLRGMTIVWMLYFVCLYYVLYSFYRVFFYEITVGSTFGYRILRLLTEKYIYYNRFIIEPLLIYPLQFAYAVTYKTLDKGVLEVVGPYGLYKFFVSSILLVLKGQTKYIHHYFNYFFIGILIMVHLVLFLF